MNSSRLSGAFAFVSAVLSEFVPSTLLTSGIEIPISSRRHGTCHGTAFPVLNNLANQLREARLA